MNPDDLLSQIMDLCQQYIQAGGDPAQVVDAVSQAAQGGGYGGDQGQGGQGQGGPPPGPPGPQDQAPMMSGDTAVPDMTGGMPLDQQQSAGFTDFGSAKAALAEAMKKKMTKAQ
jgi:hypothetical protein